MKLVRFLMTVVTLCVMGQSIDCKPPNKTRVNRMDLSYLLRQVDKGTVGTGRTMDENPDRRKRSARSIHFTHELMKSLSAIASHSKRQIPQVSNSDGQSQSNFTIVIVKIRDLAKEMADLIQKNVTDMKNKMTFGTEAETASAGSKAEAGTESIQ